MSPCAPRSCSWEAGYDSVSSRCAARGAMRSRASARTSSRVCCSSSVSQKASAIAGIISHLTVAPVLADDPPRRIAVPLDHDTEAIMPSLRTTKRVVTLLTFAGIVLAAGLYAVAQVDESKRDRSVGVGGARYHVLPATLDTTQWGWLDPKEPPKLTVSSGDTVAVETMMHSHNAIQPGTTMEEIVKLRLANPAGGPHSVTGPIYVNNAEPGDVLEIRIKK